MIAQLRTYTINKGMMDDWLKVFREEIVPLCRSMGIGVESAWVNDEGTQFTWIRTFEDARGHRAQGSRHVRQRVVGRERDVRPQPPRAPRVHGGSSGGVRVGGRWTEPCQQFHTGRPDNVARVVRPRMELAPFQFECPRFQMGREGNSAGHYASVYLV